ncbi:MAG: tetraacyldisaccharide 4'-kinase [Candidatus Cloacimonetes bacterium]|nr:tetraacyldisaccharide 4'-kinase [Candidatus Cloacimonadota bacterium]
MARMRQDLIRRHLLHRSWLSHLLYPLSLVWQWAVLRRRKKYANWGRRSAFIQHPMDGAARVRIICVGNLVSGGSGKTPFTIMLANLLRDKGYAVAVSHRGYKGAFENNPHLISGRDGVYPEALTAGDEAQLIAERLPGIPVVCGKGRRSAINLLRKRFPDLQAVILDDSFQHVQVGHDRDFVLFSAVTGIGNGFVLPAGFLREPLGVLNDSHIAVITCPAGEPPEKVDDLSKQLERFTPQIITCPMVAKDIIDASGQSVETRDLSNAPVVLVSAIGNPEGFERSVTALGIGFERHFRFPDHYAYRDTRIISMLAEYCRRKGLRYLLTTEKDWMKLRRFDNRLPGLCCLRVDAEPLIDPDELTVLVMDR